jgi:hypothetical protein
MPVGGLDLEVLGARASRLYEKAVVVGRIGFHWGFIPFIIFLGVRSMRREQSWLSLFVPTPYLH